MDSTTFVTVLESVMALAVLSWLLCALWPACRLDSFRQKVFAVRNDLFDYAAAGRIAFDDPAYTLLRQLMNGTLRYGHQITFFRLFLAGTSDRLLKRQIEPTWPQRWAAAMAKIESPSVRKDLEAFHARLWLLVSMRIVFGSPVLIAALMVSIAVILLDHGVRNIGRSLRDFRQTLREATPRAAAWFVNPERLENEAALAAS